MEFKDEVYGETRGMFVADADTYGADKEWCLLKPIAIDVDTDEPPSSGSGTDDEDNVAVGTTLPGGGASAGAGASSSRCDRVCERVLGAPAGGTRGQWV